MPSDTTNQSMQFHRDTLTPPSFAVCRQVPRWGAKIVPPTASRKSARSLTVRAIGPPIECSATSGPEGVSGFGMEMHAFFDYSWFKDDKDPELLYFWQTCTREEYELTETRSPSVIHG